jgi:2-hydroxychromene-2-carboxylate isomerase
MTAPVRFCFDFVSPYAYIAWTQIHKICAKHGRTVEIWPTLFAAMLDEHGTKGPAEVPAKRVYVFKDAYRKAHALGLPPLVPPPSHPFNPLLALRIASLPMDDAKKKALVDRLYAATWAGGGGIDTEEKVTAIAGAELVARAQTQGAKDRLRRQTEEAIAAGAFGVPTAFVDGELFWGVDSLPHIEDRLAGKDPIDGVSLATWANLPASSQRKTR